MYRNTLTTKHDYGALAVRHAPHGSKVWVVEDPEEYGVVVALDRPWWSRWRSAEPLRKRLTREYYDSKPVGLALLLVIDGVTSIVN